MPEFEVWYDQGRMHSNHNPCMERHTVYSLAKYKFKQLVDNLSL